MNSSASVSVKDSSKSQARTYYEILDVSPTEATQAEIRKSYLRLSLKYHPDKNPNNAEKAKEQFILIGEAYDILSDPTKRKAYDRELALGRRATFGNDNDEKTYESYRQAFDDRMASLSEDELNALRNVASIVGSIVGSVYGSKIGSKFGGSSKLGRALGETAGSLMGSLAGSQVGTNLVSSVHSQSVDRIVYEERKRVAKERGEMFCEPEPTNMTWNNLKSTFDQSMNAMRAGMTSSSNSSSEGEGRGLEGQQQPYQDNDGRGNGRNENKGTDWRQTGMKIIGVMKSAAQASKQSDKR